MFYRLLFGGLALVSLSACTQGTVDPRFPVSTTPKLPTASTIAGPIAEALNCVKQSGALNGTNIAVAIHADGTGKGNASADGATGNFLPQGTTAVYASQAVMMAGANAYNYYELNTERAMRTFASPNGGQRELTREEDAALPPYVLSTSFTALDFIGGPDIDVRVAGVGPHYLGRGAAVEATAEIYEPGSRAIRDISAVHRYVAFKEIGVNTGAYVGGTLVTGGVAFSDQQRLQEATRDTVALSVADVLTKLRPVPPACRGQVDTLLKGQQPA